MTKRVRFSTREENDKILDDYDFDEAIEYLRKCEEHARIIEEDSALFDDEWSNERNS